MYKKILRLTALFLVLAFAVSAFACGSSAANVYEFKEDNAWAVYSVDEAPVKTVRVGKKWYSLIGTYFGDSFELSVSKSYFSFNKVYETSGVDIWFFEANENYAAWCEQSSEARNFMVYSDISGEVTEIFSADIASGFRNSNVGLYGESVYFAYVDYAAESAAIMRYDIPTGALERFYELEYKGEYSCTSFSLDSGVLLISAGAEGAAELIKLALDSGEETRISLASSANFVFGCAYDSADGGYAVYYKDTDGTEHIGTVNAENGKIKNIFTFGENVYAYHDILEFCGGHLYWVRQINATGNVADHYRFVDYNCNTDTPEEYLKTFSFSLAEDGVTLLAFNAVEYDAIYLTEIYLGGQEG